MFLNLETRSNRHVAIDSDFVPRRASNLIGLSVLCFDNLQSKKNKIQVVVIKRERAFIPPKAGLNT